ncbi:hypothetical protein FF1_027634 [Malus domestica]
MGRMPYIWGKDAEISDLKDGLKMEFSSPNHPSNSSHFTQVHESV